MVTNRVKVFPQETQLGDMKSINSPSGYELIDIINSEKYETYVEETLYTSLNQIRFYYPITGIHFQYLKNGNHVLYPTPTGYNLYTIDNLSITTDDEILQVDAQHYSVNYMRDSAHELAIGRNAATISNINNTLTKSVYVSDDFRLVGEGTAGGGYTVKDDSYNSSLASATVGSVLVGANSVLRRYYDQYLRRNLDHLEAFKVNPYTGETQSYPIVLGINVREMDYTIDTTGIYTTAVVSASSIPNIRIEGAESIGGRYSGIGGSIWPTLEDMDDNIMFRAVYKGLPLLFVKTGGVISVGLVKLVNSSGEYMDSITDGVSSYVNGVLKVSQGDNVFLEESIDPNYFYGIEVYKTNENDNKSYQYLGKNPYPKEQGYKYTTVIPPHNVQYAVRAETEHKGNSVKYVDYESVVIEEEEEAKGLSRFFYWHFNKFKDYWTEFENQKLLEPIFEAKFTIDDMKTLYGQDVINNHIFRVGDLYKVDAQDYGLQFNAAITKTRYNGLTGELIEIEFGNRQDTELEELKVTNTNKPDKRKDEVHSGSGGSSSGSGSVSKRTDTKPVITLRETKINYQGPESSAVFRDNLISAYDKEDGDITHKVVIEQTETDATYSVTDSDGNTTTKSATIEYLGGSGGFDEDEVGSWLDKVMNGDGDLRGDKELFDGDLPYEKRTDDTGIPKMEWEPSHVTISPDGNESTPTKLVCYNGAEAVIGEVKFKGQYDTVKVRGDGSFDPLSVRNYLPDNTGFRIVPYPEGKYGTRTWTPVFNIIWSEIFNKDTEHGSYLFSEKDGSTPEDIALVKEELGYRYHYAINATTKGMIKFETERVMFQRYLREFAKLMGLGSTFGLQSVYQAKGMDEFKKVVIDRIQGQTVIRDGYDANLPNESQSLAYYLKQVDDGDQPYLKSVYRSILWRILYHVADRGGFYFPDGVITIGGILKVTVELTGETAGSARYKRIIDVEFDEDALEQQSLRDGPFFKEEPGWNRLIFTQPTTKVNDQTVRVNQLLITNGGTSTKNALISKQSIDEAWELLSPAERKEFEDTYGKEWWFNLRYTPNYYESDDVLFGAFYRANHKVKQPGDFDPFGIQAATDRKYQKVAVKISERYQQKYNFLVAKGKTVQPSYSGQAIYDRVEKHYLEQAPIE